MRATLFSTAAVFVPPTAEAGVADAMIEALWRTTLVRWDEPTMSLVEGVTVEGAIPLLEPPFRRPEAATSRSFLYPVLVARTNEGANLLLAGPGKALVELKL